MDGYKPTELNIACRRCKRYNEQSQWPLGAPKAVFACTIFPRLSYGIVKRLERLVITA